MLAQTSVAEGVSSSADHEHESLSVSEWQFSFDQGVPMYASVISVGSEAARILHQYQTGRVLAVFDRSFYVQCHQDVFCIGVLSLGQGPLQVLLASEDDRLPLEVVSGVSIFIKGHSLQSAGYDVPNLFGTDATNPYRSNASSPDRSDVPNPYRSDAPDSYRSDVANLYRSTVKDNTWLYDGKVVSRSSTPYAFQEVKDALTCIAPPRQTGFAWMPASTDWQCQEISSLTSSVGAAAIDASLVEHSLPALKCLYRWLECAMQMPREAVDDSLAQVSALLGAGPGLTPSGDDLLAGVMLALHRLERKDLAATLWHALEPQVQHRTHVISGAHLRMASQGQCSERVLLLLEHVFNDTSCHQTEDVDVIAIKIQSLANSIGESSGWDMLAGMSLVLRV